MRTLAVGAAALLPNDHKAFALLIRFRKILSQVQESVLEPWLLVHAVIAEFGDRQADLAFFGLGGRCGARGKANQQKNRPADQSGYRHFTPLHKLVFFGMPWLQVPFNCRFR